MTDVIRLAAVADVAQITAIYAPFCVNSVVSFEEVAPSVEEMGGRIAATLEQYPWLVFEEADTRAVEKLAIVDPLRPERGADVVPYPRAGRENARVRLVVGVIRLVEDIAQLARTAGKDKAQNAPMTRVLSGLEVKERESLYDRMTLADGAGVAGRRLWLAPLLARCMGQDVDCLAANGPAAICMGKTNILDPMVALRAD